MCLQFIQVAYYRFQLDLKWVVAILWLYLMYQLQIFQRLLFIIMITKYFIKKNNFHVNSPPENRLFLKVLSQFIFSKTFVANGKYN